jgi:nucleoid DNA-binding protein
MQKSEFIETLSKTLDTSKAHAEKYFNTLFEHIGKLLSEGDELMVPGFGRFTIVHKAARIGRNPQGGAEIKISA